jgi:hypothetical protein
MLTLRRYYFLFGTNIATFPKGFRMVAGNATRRTSTLPTPVPDSSHLGANDTTQQALQEKALGFNCMNSHAAAEGALKRHSMPNKSFIDTQCADGIRAELQFPSCWDGTSLDSYTHNSHVAYPDLVSEGKCPPSHRFRFPSLYFETIWDTSVFKNSRGIFAFSNGDPSGYGYHGDFLNGWDIGVLSQAITKCTNLTGRVEDCSSFTLQPSADMLQCKLSPPKEIERENCLGPRQGFCGLQA